MNKKSADTANMQRSQLLRYNNNALLICHILGGHVQVGAYAKASRVSFGVCSRLFAPSNIENICREIDAFPIGELPRRFDAREKWPLCGSLHHVPNQGGCGACYVSESERRERNF